MQTLNLELQQSKNYRKTCKENEIKTTSNYFNSIEKISKIKIRVRRVVKKIHSNNFSEFLSPHKPFQCLILLTFLFEKSGLMRLNNENKILFYINYILYGTVVTQLGLNLIFVYFKSREIFYIQLFTAYFNIATFLNYNILIITKDKRAKLIHYMRKYFISSHPLYRKCIKYELVFSFIISALFTISSVVWFMQPWITPVSNEEMIVYNFSKPYRRFSTQFWTPFDITASPYYEIYFPFLIIATTLVAVLSLELFSSLPIIGLHVKTQLDILSYYLTLVGHPNILSVNIRSGEIIYHTTETQNNTKLIMQNTKHLLKQIIHQHQRILYFIQIFEQNNQIFFAFRIFLTISLLLAALCQYVFTTSQRFYIFLNVISVMQFNFFLCTSSELINSGYYSVHKRSYDNNWYLKQLRDKDITRQLILIKLASPKYKYLKFKYLDIGFQSFIASIRLTYSLLVFLFYVQK